MGENFSAIIASYSDKYSYNGVLIKLKVIAIAIDDSVQWIILNWLPGMRGIIFI